MPNEFDSCFTELHDCFEAVTSQTQQVTINGTPYDVIVTEISKDDMLIHGGSGENGGFSVIVRASAFGVAPAKIQTIVYGTTTLSVLSFKQANNATYEIVAGDFTRNP
jgi:hypothetical protein